MARLYLDEQGRKCTIISGFPGATEGRVTIVYTNTLPLPPGNYTAWPIDRKLLTPIPDSEAPLRDPNTPIATRR